MQHFMRFLVHKILKIMQKQYVISKSVANVVLNHFLALQKYTLKIQIVISVTTENDFE